ncbi:hypothetical protein R1sor_007313 [Riccia sorocarpa]|uniref:Uncharacterized protein n=1 Tax=Riccia sorocarpa TaxID=122646 RepID=A0ABD3HQ30_9MARC
MNLPALVRGLLVKRSPTTDDGGSDESGDDDDIKTEDVPATPEKPSGPSFGSPGPAAATEHHAKTNSGKRKGEVSKSASVLVEALEKIITEAADAHTESEKSRQDRDAQKQKWQEGANLSKQTWLSELEDRCQTELILLVGI